MLYLKSLIVKLLSYSKIANLKLKFYRQDIVLLYHSIERTPSDYPFSVSQENFKAHLDMLSNYFEIVPIDKLVNTPGQKPRVALTFDDAYDDFYTSAFPVLQERQLCATVFVPTKFIDSNLYVYMSAEEKYQKYHLTWDQMRELQSSGLVEFGSHTHSHIDAVENIDILKDDVLTSMRTIEKELGRSPKYFAYPYGDCTSTTHEIVLGCGFEKIFTTQNIPVTTGDVQGRHNVWRPNENNGRFMLTIAGIKS